jgi:hypothetical protein
MCAEMPEAADIVNQGKNERKNEETGSHICAFIGAPTYRCECSDQTSVTNENARCPRAYHRSYLGHRLAAKTADHVRRRWLLK